MLENAKGFTEDARDYTEYLAIIDTLHRFAAGQDTGDRPLLESAFSEGASFDFSHAAARIGATIPVFEGRSQIVDTITAALSGLRTAHTVSNGRVLSYDGDRASLYALVEALHVAEADENRYLLLKNIYRVEAERHAADWRMTRVAVHNIWYNGDVSLLGGRAT